MASKGQLAINEHRRALVAKYAPLRKELRDKLKNTRLSMEERDAAMVKLDALPKNSCPTRVCNRCVVTGRPRGYYRKFGLSRIMLRHLGLRGEVPGLTKSSW